MTLEEFQEQNPSYYYSLGESPSWREVALYPGRAAGAYWRRLVGCYSRRFVLLCLSAYVLKGGLYQAILATQLPYFKDHLGVSGAAYQRAYAVAMAPWSLKGLLGALSDLLPVAGLHKRYYLLLATALGSLACLLLGTVEFGAEAATAVALLFALGHLEISFTDLLVEGKYTELLNAMPYTGPDIVSWVWVVYNCAALAASSFVGPLADAGRFRTIFLVCLPVAAQLAVPALLGWLPERPSPTRGFQTAKFRRHRRVWVLAAFMAAVAVALLLANVYLSATAVLALSVLLSGAACGSLFWGFSPALAKAVTYNFLVKATYVTLEGALGYYYTSAAPCVAGGPAFSWTYYQTFSGIAQTFFGIIGTMLFQLLMASWSLRRVFWVSILLRTFASFVDIALVRRWNLALGINDHLFYMFGYNALAYITYMIEFMAGVLLISKLCSRSIETTMYAILAGMANLGVSISTNFGVFLIDAAGIVTTPSPGAPCNFDNLSWVIFIGHTLLPLVGVPLSFLLIPDLKATDSLLQDDQEVEVEEEEEQIEQEQEEEIEKVEEEEEIEQEEEEAKEELLT